MPIKTLIMGVDNYRGFCIEAIAQTNHYASDKELLIKSLPLKVSYDLYVASISIIESNHYASDKVKLLKATFGI